MPKPRKPRLTRARVVHIEDAVTHERTHQVRDALFEAVQRAVGAVENAGLGLPSPDYARRYEDIVRTADQFLAGWEAGQIDPTADWVEPLKTLAREYLATDRRPEFVRQVRERLAGMQRHTGGHGHAMGRKPKEEAA